MKCIQKEHLKVRTFSKRGIYYYLSFRKENCIKYVLINLHFALVEENYILLIYGSIALCIGEEINVKYFQV